MLSSRRTFVIVCCYVMVWWISLLYSRRHTYLACFIIGEDFFCRCEKKSTNVRSVHVYRNRLNAENKRNLRFCQWIALSGGKNIQIRWGSVIIARGIFYKYFHWRIFQINDSFYFIFLFSILISPLYCCVQSQPLFVVDNFFNSVQFRRSRRRRFCATRKQTDKISG